MLGREWQINLPRERENKWYDLFEDWELIESSFAMQYGIRLRSDPEMSWSEFSSLLSGIMPDTPLGQIVQIRSEEDKDKLKEFNQAQHRIRNEWRNKITEEMKAQLTEEEQKAQIDEIQKMFENMFGNKST